MKFQPDQALPTAVRAYGSGWIKLAGSPGAKRIITSVILFQESIEPWDCARFDDLSERHFALLAAHKPELVIFGSGARQRFPKPAWVRALIDAGIGIETMNTLAACRTWNILIGEGRRALAALLLENAQPTP